MNISTVLSQVPARCIPILSLNANGRVDANFNGIPTPDEHIGPAEPDRTIFNGRLLHDFLRKHMLFAANTFAKTGPTYHGPKGETSRVDYICLPLPFKAALQKAEVWRRTGIRMQKIRALRFRDHLPFVVTADLHLYFKPTEKTRWDMDGICANACFGVGREQFLREIEKNAGGEDWKQLATESSDKAAQTLNNIVTQISKQFYHAVPKKQQPRPKDTQEAIQKRLFYRKCQQRPVYKNDSSIIHAFHVNMFRFINASDSLKFASVSKQVCDGIAGQLVLSRGRCADNLFYKLLKRDASDKMKEYERELEEHFRSGRFADYWKVVRILSGKRIGPRLRSFCRPSWTADTNAW